MKSGLDGMESQFQENLNEQEVARFVKFHNTLNQFTGMKQIQDRIWWLGHMLQKQGNMPKVKPEKLLIHTIIEKCNQLSNTK